MEECTLNALWHEEKKTDRELALAQAYIPFQSYGQLYPPLQGLIKGTIFPELYRPYEKSSNRESRKPNVVY